MRRRSRAVEAYAERRPIPETRSFEEREIPFRALAHDALVRRIGDETTRMNRLLADVLAREPDAVVPWTQRQMRVGKFGTHMRNEFALHRWDVAGDDPVSLALLSQPELTAHSVEVLGHILPRQGMEAATGVPDGSPVRLRSPRTDDVVLSVHDGSARMTEDREGDGERILQAIRRRGCCSSGAAGRPMARACTARWSTRTSSGSLGSAPATEPAPGGSARGVGSGGET